MEPHILESAEALMSRPGILGVVLFRQEKVYFQKTDPRFRHEQLETCGRFVHALFSGYLNVQRRISEVSLLFNGACLTILMLQEDETPLYLATLAENLESLSLAMVETRLWAVEDLMRKSKRQAKITTKLRPTVHLLWGRFLARLRDCLDRALGMDSGSVVLIRSLESFKVTSSDPLPKEQWLAFVAEVGNQIPNPDARIRFYKLYSEVEQPVEGS
jgi:hypothetical protein